MAKKKAKGNSGLAHLEMNTPTPEQASENEAKAFAVNVSAEPSRGYVAKPRFSVQLKEDGSLDLEAMRAETRERLKEILKDPRTMQLLGPEVGVELVSDQDIRMLYDMISMIEAYAFTFAGKIDFDIAQKHARWTEEQKTMILTPTKNVVLKNADKLAVALRWKDEVVLAMLFLTISRAKFEGARKEQAVRNEQRKQENPATSSGAEATPIQ